MTTNSFSASNSYNPSDRIKTTRDCFKNFRGFASEGRFETFVRQNPDEAAIFILKQHKGEKIKLDYRPIGFEFISVPIKDHEIESLLRDTTADCIRIRIPDKEGYVLQKIVIGDQSITEIDREWKD